MRRIRSFATRMYAFAETLPVRTSISRPAWSLHFYLEPSRPMMNCRKEHSKWLSHTDKRSFSIRRIGGDRMSELRDNLKDEFQDHEYRHAYAGESLSAYIATQIKVLREQGKLTQLELAKLAGMAQPRIAVLEDVNYSSWSITTLRRLAQAFDVRLFDVRRLT